MERWRNVILPFVRTRFLWILGVIVACVIIGLDESGRTIVTPNALGAIRGDLFNGIIATASLLLGVLLAILAILTGLDESRPILKRMRADGVYRRLVDAVVQPAFGFLLVVPLAIVCMLLPELPAVPPDATPAARDAAADAAVGSAATGLVAVVLGLAAIGVLQVAYVVYLIKLVLTHETKPQQTAADATDYLSRIPNPDAVRRLPRAKPASETPHGLPPSPSSDALPQAAGPVSLPAPPKAGKRPRGGKLKMEPSKA